MQHYVDQPNDAFFDLRLHGYMQQDAANRLDKKKAIPLQVMSLEARLVEKFFLQIWIVYKSPSDKRKDYDVEEQASEENDLESKDHGHLQVVPLVPVVSIILLEFQSLSMLS